MRSQGWRVALTLLAVGLMMMSTPDAFAGRGGGRGGGFRGGMGGGGFRGGGFGGGGMGRTPSFGGGMGGRPGGNFGGMGGRPGGNFGGMGGRPNFNPGGSVMRPGGNFGGNRPNIGGGNFGGNRPNIGGGNFGGNRPNIGDRPNIGGGNLGLGNRPNIGDRPNIGGGNLGLGNRPNIGDRPNIGGGNIGNRPNIGGGNIGDRTNIGGGNLINNRPNIGGGNIGDRTNIGNNFNNVNFNRNNFFNNNGGYWPGRSPYYGYHAGWVHGYWSGAYGNRWGAWGVGPALWGLAAWGYGSSLYNWGYMPYSNPYYTQPVVIQQNSPVYDYSQPINTQAAAPSQDVADPAVQSFDQARDAFGQGNYQQALDLTNQALQTMPNDATLHEFRALCLFALGQYDQAAATLYAVLSVGPGWDWTTLISLYPNSDTYTKQLRALEAYRNEHPDSAQAHFVLAYHYLTDGFDDAAAKELAKVVKLEPNDKLSAQLLAQLQAPPADSASPGANDQPPPPPTDANRPPAGKPGDLVGAWKATPTNGPAIDLSLDKSGAFTWTINPQAAGQTAPPPIQGEYTEGNGLLTLAQKDGSPLVGDLTWIDPSQFNFRISGASPSDPGLTFQK